MSCCIQCSLVTNNNQGLSDSTHSLPTDSLLHVVYVDEQVIAAEGEQKAARALKEASDVISESSLALQLRYLQTLNTISAEKNSTIIFPMPIEFLNCAMQSPLQPQQPAGD